MGELSSWIRICVKFLHNWASQGMHSKEKNKEKKKKKGSYPDPSAVTSSHVNEQHQEMGECNSARERNQQGTLAHFISEKGLLYATLSGFN